MAAAAVNGAASAAVDFADVQGLVRFGYRQLTEASFLLLRVRDGAAARRWLGGAPIAHAVAQDTAPPTAMQVAFTREGLEALGLAPGILEQFSTEFLGGMAGDEGRSRLLGDVGANAPGRWTWGATGRVPHVLLMLYAQPGRLDGFVMGVRGQGWDEAFEELACLDTSDLGGVEPFGFPDGISQPALDWEQRRSVAKDQLVYGNVLSLGEFLLGYPNEYGRYTSRPLVSPAMPGGADLGIAEDHPELRDLGKNGCYLVLRTLEQDVRGFWQFVEEAAREHGLEREALAESMVGRRRDGTPLALLATEAIEGVPAQQAALNQFTFEGDSQASRCPFGAHVRRANPRNADLPTPAVHGLRRFLRTLGFGIKTLEADAKASTRFHRILRRGREYGSLISPEEALAGGGEAGAHGIHFVCLAANIARQFEFLQSAWLMSTKFDAMTEESDPLLGSREPVVGCPSAARFTLPREGAVRQRIAGVPQFVTVRGGAYFFLPGLRALRFLAREDDESSGP